MNWTVDPESLTAGGDPKQFYGEHNGAYGELFLLTATRVSGPTDAHMPRRVLATGRTRASARVSLDETISAYDPSYSLVDAS